MDAQATRHALAQTALDGLAILRAACGVRFRKHAPLVNKLQLKSAATLTLAHSKKWQQIGPAIGNAQENA